MNLRYQDLLTALAENAGLEAESLLATEEIIIEDLPISMQLVGEGEQAEVLLCGLLGVVPADRWVEVTRNLLLANHLWTGTGGATLGLLAEDNMVSLSVRRFLHELDADQLSILLGQIVDIGLTWQDFISQAQSTPTQADATFGLHV